MKSDRHLSRPQQTSIGQARVCSDYKDSALASLNNLGCLDSRHHLFQCLLVNYNDASTRLPFLSDHRESLSGSIRLSAASYARVAVREGCFRGAVLTQLLTWRVSTSLGPVKAGGLLNRSACAEALAARETESPSTRFARSEPRAKSRSFGAGLGDASAIM